MERRRQPDRRAVVVVPRDCAVTKSQCSCAPQSTRYILTASTFTFPPMTGAAAPQRNQGEATIRSGHDPAAAQVASWARPERPGAVGPPESRPEVVDCSPRTAGAPRRPAARSFRSLASDGGDPSPATSCGSFFQIARLGRRGPQPRDVLRLALQELRSAEWVREPGCPGIAHDDRTRSRYANRCSHSDTWAVFQRVRSGGP
jgi:hypothetical protein